VNPLKVIFDTSALRVLSDQVPRKLAALHQAIQDGRVEFYASDPVIAETVNIQEENRLKRHTNYLGLLANGKYFVPWEGAVYHELCGQPQVLRGGEDERIMTSFLMGVTHGQSKPSIAAIATHMNQEKDRLYAYYLSLQRSAQAKFGDDLRKPVEFPYEFDYVDRGFWVRRGADLVTRARLLGNDDPVSMKLGSLSNNRWTKPLVKLLGSVLHGGLARRVVRNPGQYPYTRHYARIFAMLIYRNLALNESVGRNDPYDAQVVYWGRECDALLTHDAGQKGRFLSLYDGGKQVHKVKELLLRLGIR
jgi:hypothetical protein